MPKTWILQSAGAMVLFGLEFFVVRLLTDRGTNLYLVLAIYAGAVALASLAAYILLPKTGPGIEMTGTVVWLIAWLVVLASVANILSVKAQSTAPNPAYAWAIMGMNILVIVFLYSWHAGVRITLTKLLGMVTAVLTLILFSV